MIFENFRLETECWHKIFHLRNGTAQESWKRSLALEGLTSSNSQMEGKTYDVTDVSSDQCDANLTIHPPTSHVQSLRSTALYLHYRIHLPVTLHLLWRSLQHHNQYFITAEGNILRPVIWEAHHPSQSLKLELKMSRIPPWNPLPDSTFWKYISPPWGLGLGWS